MTIHGTCPECENPFSAPDEAKGRLGACPKCGHRFQLASLLGEPPVDAKQGSGRAIREARAAAQKRLQTQVAVGVGVALVVLVLVLGSLRNDKKTPPPAKDTPPESRSRLGALPAESPAGSESLYGSQLRRAQEEVALVSRGLPKLPSTARARAASNASVYLAKQIGREKTSLGRNLQPQESARLMQRLPGLVALFEDSERFRQLAETWPLQEEMVDFNRRITEIRNAGMGPAFIDEAVTVWLNEVYVLYDHGEIPPYKDRKVGCTDPTYFTVIALKTLDKRFR